MLPERMLRVAHHAGVVNPADELFVRLLVRRRIDRLQKRDAMRSLINRLPTNAQAVVLDAIDEFEAFEARSPSVFEIAESLGISSSGVWIHLRRLRSLGYLTWDPGRVRTLRRGGGILVVGEVG